MSKTTPHQSQESGKPGNTGVKRIIKATGYSIQGLKAAFKHEAAVRQELALLSIAVILACVVDVGMIERILLIGVVVLVLIVELINSAIEAVVDRIGVERHELSGRAKDIGSAAVMVALAFAAFTWLYILASRCLG
ncbi:diacylglycerol kinase [Vibrio parahaemolyticus]|uniref:diacylglycerol kinase n=1 Tax=Vibrio parahaemolyticus TaxID=670 RepID=UPI0003591DF2|nr:diacylglycerol kinase [Vibrio parahaemolyticus]NVJ68062.1 diacylglycerol kinase [Gammaproteobacteria bacterium]PWF69916.1 diacylglycerol kinase [Vibrio sp. T21]AGQ89902.1 DeoR family transcriptional regulator [Vibrio parahaemolyticus O1:Kuk str. FDA_R31]EGQ7822927.1 diacylglycerol kinase [Vibrio parahaemolyticus]EGQ8134178.1 diacylglycerol kinase [Vibrio parahaemolyticus]